MDRSCRAYWESTRPVPLRLSPREFRWARTEADLRFLREEIILMTDETPTSVPRLDFRKRLISPPVKDAMEAASAGGREAALVPVIISPKVSVDHPEAGINPSKEALVDLLKEYRPRASQFYVFAKLPAGKIEELGAKYPRLIDHIWKDEKCEAHLLDSVKTIKASASWKTFDAFGQGINWAIMDTGIEAAHPQFAQYCNVSTAMSRDFSDPDNPKSANPLKDSNGHGTHVAGIIAGVMKTDSSGLPSVSERFEEGMRITQLSGYRPESLRNVNWSASKFSTIPDKGMPPPPFSRSNTCEASTARGRRSRLMG